MVMLLCVDLGSVAQLVEDRCSGSFFWWWISFGVWFLEVFLLFLFLALSSAEREQEREMLLLKVVCMWISLLGKGA